MTAALVATLVANVFYLTMTFYYFYVFATLAVALPVVVAVRAARMKVLVLTTSYPRGPDDVAGRLRARRGRAPAGAGVEVEVVSPASFRHFGLAYGHGIVGNLKRAAVEGVLLPLFLALVRACGAACGARTWISSTRTGFPPRSRRSPTRKPFVLQLWGTDVELARARRWFARPLVRRARIVLCPSEALADAARELGARDVRVVPSGVAIPDEVGEPDEPPHVLFVGRLSRGEGHPELLEATEGIAACRSSATARSATASPTRSGSSRRASSVRTTSGRPSSSARRAARATASSRARRWLTAGPWSRPPSAGSSMPSRTV